jgi:hypothetical protein
MVTEPPPPKKKEKKKERERERERRGEMLHINNKQFNNN